MHALKSALHADKFATFWMFPKKFYHSFVLQMTLLYTLEAAERKYTCAIPKQMKRMYQGKTQCWAVL